MQLEVSFKTFCHSCLKTLRRVQVPPSANNQTQSCFCCFILLLVWFHCYISVNVIFNNIIPWACVVLKIGGYINNSPVWRENMLGYFSVDIICSEKQTVFQERSSRETVSYEEQVMPKDKYPSIFSPKMEAIVFIILQIFFATHKVFKIGEYSRIFPSFSWRIFAHVTCLDQSCVSEKIWWIIILIIKNWIVG